MGLNILIFNNKGADQFSVITFFHVLTHFNKHYNHHEHTGTEVFVIDSKAANLDISSTCTRINEHFHTEPRDLY